MIAAFLFFMMTMICLGFIVVWVMTMVEIIRSDFDPKEERLIFLLLVILLPVIGTILYYMIGRRRRVADSDDLL